MTAVVLTVLAFVAFGLAVLYAAVTLANLSIFRAPEGSPDGTPRISILIPARDEAANMPAAIDAALAQTGVTVELVVLDDGSTDATAAIVADRAARDPRVRLAQGTPLPDGWNGKQHACHQLSQHARHETFLFVDADVRLAPDAAARLCAHLDRRGLDLVSGFPHQITRTLIEKVAIPQILVVLLGYLPLWMARRSDAPAFAAGCGQLLMVRAGAYGRAGGHARFAHLMHDGLNLPRNVRRAGGSTDIVDATPLASCRMYDNWADIRSGFTKNATEGMAKPVALPVWTVLLGGGHILPWLLLPAAGAAGAGWAAALSALAIALVLSARAVLALRVRQSWLSVLLHPAGVALTLAIQWSALIGARRGRQAVWRGRRYDFQ
ncbi:glycosyltransferase family A protein [Jannaschia rubra]|uniref:glycosyltransferase family A protein n=1 Tax=Jannaschia rubra TaxID=282197 RepID=UPI0024926AE6|nr:glycosyltransferase family A protein [Jannaschia rubra]